MSESVKLKTEDIDSVKQIQTKYLQVQQGIGQVRVSLIKLDQQRDVLMKAEADLNNKFLETQKEYLKENFPIDWISQKEVKSSQDEVNKLFDRCLQNFKYKPSPQELELFKSANMNTQSSRWLMRKMKGANRKFDLDEYFNRFEITLQNNPQPIYKLCAPFNSALSHNNFDPKYDKDEGNQRVKNLEHRIHILIQDKIINMFKDWFRKKYVGDEIQVIKIDKELYFHTSRTRTGYRV